MNLTKKSKESETELSQLMRPDAVNCGGKVFGGYILQLADSIAYVCAVRHSGKYCVTASVDAVDFHKPIEIGNVVNLKAKVNYVHNTSMEIGVRLEAENPRDGKKFHATTCYFTMVAVDDNFKPVNVPQLELETDEERQRFEDAKIRRETRLKRMEKRKRVS